MFFGLNYFPGHLPSFGAKTFQLQTIHTILGHGTRRRKEGRKKGRKEGRCFIYLFHSISLHSIENKWFAQPTADTRFTFSQHATGAMSCFDMDNLLAQIIGSVGKHVQERPTLAHQSSPARNRCNKMDPSRWENIPAFAQLCALLSKNARRRENKGRTSLYLISRCIFVFNDVALWYIGQKFPASPKCMVPLLQSSEPRTLCVGESVGCTLCSVHCSVQFLCFSTCLSKILWCSR